MFALSVTLESVAALFATPTMATSRSPAVLEMLTVMLVAAAVSVALADLTKLGWFRPVVDGEEN